MRFKGYLIISLRYLITNIGNKRLFPQFYQFENIKDLKFYFLSIVSEQVGNQVLQKLDCFVFPFLFTKGLGSTVKMILF